MITISLEAKAQQTIINVPSPDVLKTGQIYTRMTYRFRPFQPDPYEVVTPSLVYGLSNTQELYLNVGGLNFVETPSPIPGSPPVSGISPFLGISYKKVFMLTPTTRYTIGNRMDVSLVSETTPTNFSYTHFSQEIPFTKTRLTAGIYTQSGTHFFPNRTGALLGFEQYIIPGKVQIDVDWISRNETFGFLAAGFKIRPGHGFVIVPAVLIPNGSQSKFGFIFFIGKIFR